VKYEIFLSRNGSINAAKRSKIRRPFTLKKSHIVMLGETDKLNNDNITRHKQPIWDNKSSSDQISPRQMSQI